MASKVLLSCTRCMLSKFCKLPANDSSRRIFTLATSSRAILQRRVFPRWNQVAFYYVKPKEKKGPSIKNWAIFGGSILGFITATGAYLGRPMEEDEERYKEENLMMQYVYRARDQVVEFVEVFREPSSKKLLPEPLQEPYYQPPYTLVLEMTDILVHPEYDRTSGWRFRKRPGVDAFLSQLGPPLYEIVVYTHENGFNAAPVLEGLDPQGFIMYKLFRDATKYTGGAYVKDLTCLNRDLSKVIMIDCDGKAAEAGNRNTVLLKKWEGDPTDRTLLDLIPLLQTIATSEVDDVRNVLDFYRQEDDIVEAFKRNQAKLQQQELERLEMMKQNKGSTQWSGLFGKGLFGGK